MLIPDDRSMSGMGMLTEWNGRMITAGGTLKMAQLILYIQEWQ